VIKKQIVLNFISAWVSKMVKLGTALYITPMYIEVFGKENFGLIILLGTILAFSALADFGIRSGLIRYLAKSIAVKDNHSFNQYVNTSLLVYLCIWTVLTGLLLFFAADIVAFFKIPPSLVSLAILLLRTYGVISLFFNFCTPIFAAVSSSYNRYDVTNYREMIISFISIITIIIAVKYFHVGVIGWAVITVLFQILTFGVITLLAFRFAPYMKISTAYLSKTKFSEILKFGGITFIGGWSRKMKIDADPLVLSSFYGPGVIPLYRSGVSIPSHTRPLIAALSGQINTVSTSLYAQGDMKRFYKLFESGSKYTILMGTGMLVLLTVFAYPISHLWLGKVLNEEDIMVVARCMQLMAIVDFCFYIEGSSYTVLYAMNRLRFMTFTDIFLGVTNILASIALLKYSSLGTIAVLIPTVVLEGIARPFYLFYTASEIGYERYKVFMHILLPVLPVIGATFLGAFATRFFTSEFTLFTLILNIGIVGLIWLASVWFLSLNAEEKKEVRSLINKKK
jgi:O-antigen/teichoic acid export membrane protein